ncbi:MAG: RNA polymerase sigma factor [Chloroflexota bacterium]
MREVAIASGFPIHDPAPEDAALVALALTDGSAFGDLYERYRDRIYWYLRTRTENSEDAADLLQQVFLQALDKLPQYNPKKGLFVAWLFGIARHTASNHRRRGRSTVAWDLVPEVLRPASLNNPESQVLRNESLEELAVLLQALHPDQRELLVLRYITGLSFAEIGQIIGKSEAASRKKFGRILRDLKEQYREHQ